MRLERTLGETIKHEKTTPIHLSIYTGWQRHSIRTRSAAADAEEESSDGGDDAKCRTSWDGWKLSADCCCWSVREEGGRRRQQEKAI